MNKKLNKLTEADIHRIVKESVNRILMEMPTRPVGTQQTQQGSLSPRLQKVMSAVAEIASLVNGGAKCVPFDSTWQQPYTVYYTASVYRGNAVRVTRVEQPMSYYLNNGMKSNEKPTKDTWIITDRNYTDKWIGLFKDGLKYQISYDKRAYKKLNT
jgi:hypothetical protein